MVVALFDTNIIIDYLNGEEQAKKEFAAFPKKLLSGISYMEVLVGAAQDAEVIKHVLASVFDIIWLNQTIADKAIEVRRKYKIKLPDAIIMATALVHEAFLVTRNTKDFTTELPFVRVPYSL